VGEGERRYIHDRGEENVVIERRGKDSSELLQPVDESQKELLLQVRVDKYADGIDVFHSHRHEKRDDEIGR